MRRFSAGFLLVVAEVSIVYQAIRYCFIEQNWARGRWQNSDVFHFRGGAAIVCGVVLLAFAAGLLYAGILALKGDPIGDDDDP